MKRRLSEALIVLFIASGCTFRIGSLTRSSNIPAPTTLPLADTSKAGLPAGLSPPQKPITLPVGFAINVYADGLNDPRMMAVGPDGSLYVAERGGGRIIRLPDQDGNGEADAVETVHNELNRPSSLAFYKDGSLYVGLTNRVLRLSEPDSKGVFQKREIVIPDLPPGGHNTRTVLFNPDSSTLFVSIGSSCNVCIEEDQRRAAIIRYNPDGSGETIFARGLRNAVGMAFRPGTDELWATNNGRDMLGDDLPPETVNLVREGADFGWPRCHAGRISDPEFGGTSACQGVEPPAVEMQAHSAPLGLAFYTGEQFPDEYRGDLFVAFHGSWNRSTPTGYKVVRIAMEGGQPGAVQDFAVGWLTGDGTQSASAWGRPVDVITGSDGSLYVSDDAGGVIYRIFYSNSP